MGLYCLSGVFLATLVILSLYDIHVVCKENNYERKEVVVVGGGLAGMSAARRLMKESNIAVKVLEARKDRYGGRIWTNREAATGVRGVDVEVGGMFLNTKANNNSLISLAEEFELPVENSGKLQVTFVDENGEKKNFVGDDAISLYSEAFKIVIEALQKAKRSNEDKSVKQVLVEAVESDFKSGAAHKYEQSMMKQVIRSFPAVILQDFSSLLYRIESDFGWDAIVVDGMGALLDRIVAGSGFEAPLKLELNKVVRNIKVDEKRKKVVIRTVDRKQILADAVVVALPIGVLKSGSVIFEPSLSPAWYKAVKSIGVGYSSKVVVGFDKIFWPEDVGTFHVFSELASDGFLQTWTSTYKLSGNPYLIGNIFGLEAKLWEEKPEKELKELVKLVLGEVFGREKVDARNITTFIHSKWSIDEFVLGSVSYPQVGNTPDMWKTLQAPVCPYIYFAGAYTETVSHIDSLHGAYNSGVRAAEEIIKGTCRKSKAKSGKDKEQKSTKPESKTNKKAAGASKTKQKKDEL